jgi:chromosome segregation ATPase
MLLGRIQGDKPMRMRDRAALKAEPSFANVGKSLSRQREEAEPEEDVEEVVRAADAAAAAATAAAGAPRGAAAVLSPQSANSHGPAAAAAALEESSSRLNQARARHRACMGRLGAIQDIEMENAKLRLEQVQLMRQLQDFLAGQKVSDGGLDRLRMENEELRRRQEELLSRNEMLEGQVNQLVEMIGGIPPSLLAAMASQTSATPDRPRTEEAHLAAIRDRDVARRRVDTDAALRRCGTQAPAAQSKGMRSPPLIVPRRPERSLHQRSVAFEVLRGL